MLCQNSKHCLKKVVARRRNHIIDVGLNHKIPTRVSVTDQVKNQVENIIDKKHKTINIQIQSKKKKHHVHGSGDK